MSAINKYLHVRKNQAGVSILELILYVIFAAGVVLAAWFGLNMFLDKGKESAAKQNLVSTYKVARVYKDSEPQFNGNFPNKAQLLPYLHNEFGADKVVNVTDYSTLDEMQTGILEALPSRLVAGVRYSENMVLQITAESANGGQTDSQSAIDITFQTIDLSATQGQLTVFWDATPAPETNSTSASFKGKFVESNLDLECRLDNEAWFDCNEDGTPWVGAYFSADFTDLTAGEHSFQVRTAGGTVHETITWEVVAAPLDNAGGWNVTQNGSTAQVMANIQQPDLDVECRLDSRPWINCTASAGFPLPLTLISATFENVTPGQHTVTVRLAGGGAVQGSHTWTQN